MRGGDGFYQAYVDVRQAPHPLPASPLKGEEMIFTGPA
jgi:hypothetical protein